MDVKVLGVRDVERALLDLELDAAAAEPSCLGLSRARAVGSASCAGGVAARVGEADCDVFA